MARAIMAPASRLTSPAELCACGEQHHPGARYYVSVRESDGGKWRPVLGPFSTHAQARAHVDAVTSHVLDHYNPGGRAHWYSYGTVAMMPDYDTPGLLNGALLATTES